MLTESFILAEVHFDWSPVGILLSYDKEIWQLMIWDPFNLETRTMSDEWVTLHVWSLSYNVKKYLAKAIWIK